MRKRIGHFFIWLLGPFARFYTWHVQKMTRCGGCGAILPRSEMTSIGCSACWWKAMQLVRKGLKEKS